MSCVAISSVGYYQRQADQTARELAAFAVGHDAQLLQTARSNYYDNGTVGAAELSIDGAFGTFAVLEQDPEPAYARSEERSDPFRDIIDGAPAHPDVVRALAAGRDPGTGQILVETTHDRRVAGYDLQLSAPKSVSILALLGSDELRRAIIRAHDRAIRATLDYIAREGLFQCRTGKGGSRRRGARKLVAALYRHYTSRKNDPQLHTHCVVFNIAIREDGTIGGIDNLEVKRLGGAIEALYRCELAAGLRENLGIEVVHYKRNFEVAGVDRSLVDAFSKRRQDILAVAAAEQFSTAQDRAAAQRASYKTRDRKDDGLDLATLQQHWIAELAALGLTPDTLFERVLNSSESVRSERANAGFDRDADRRARLSALIQNNVVVTQPQLLRICAEAGQVDKTLNQAVLSARTVADSLVRLPSTAGNAPIYLDPDAIEMEHAMLKTAHSLVGRWQPPPNRVIQAAIDASGTLSQEQAEAVRWVLRDDGISCMEGSAGSGKSRSCSIIVAALETSGFEVAVLSPSWRATDVVRRETGVLSERAIALQGFSLGLANGTTRLTSRSVVLIDEAGMAGLVDVATVVDAVEKAGAKLILTGDTRQLQPVSAGAPMSALASLLGSQRINTIRRQHEPWMQAASMALAAGDGARGIEAYFDRGAIRTHESRAHTLVAAMRDYLDGLPADETERVKSTGQPSQILIASWNEDVAALNMLVRGAMIQQGLIAREGITFDAVPRGAGAAGNAVEITLAANDRIIFGERITVAGFTVFNSDLATVTDVRSGSEEPILSVRLDRRADDGSVIAFSAPVSQFVRPSKSPALVSVPKIQHAHCVTCHAAQGMTVDRVVVANLRGMGAEETYVAMTRHRVAVTMHVDQGRIIGQNSPTRIDLSSAGTLQTTDDREPEEDFNPAEMLQAQRQDALVLQALKREATRRNCKTSPSDYVPNLSLWLKSSDPVGAFRSGLEPKSFSQHIRERIVARQATARPPKHCVGDPLAFTQQEAAALAQQSVPDLLLAKLDCREIPSPSAAGTGTARTFEHLKTGIRVTLDKNNDIVSASEGPPTAALPASESRLIKIVMVLTRATIAKARRLIRTACDIWQGNPLASAARRARTRWSATTSPAQSAHPLLTTRIVRTGIDLTDEELIAEQALQDDRLTVARHRSARHRMRQFLRTVAPARAAATQMNGIAEEEILAEVAQRDDERTIARHRSARHRLRHSLRSGDAARVPLPSSAAAEEEILAELALQDEELTVRRHRLARLRLRQIMLAAARPVAPDVVDERDRLPSPPLQPIQVEAAQGNFAGTQGTGFAGVANGEAAPTHADSVHVDMAEQHRIQEKLLAAGIAKSPAPPSSRTTPAQRPPQSAPLSNRDAWAQRRRIQPQPETKLLIGALDPPITAPRALPGRESPLSRRAEGRSNRHTQGNSRDEAANTTLHRSEQATAPQPSSSAMSSPRNGGPNTPSQLPPNAAGRLTASPATAEPAASARTRKAHAGVRSAFPGLDPDKMVIREYNPLDEIPRRGVASPTPAADAAATAKKPDGLKTSHADSLAIRKLSSLEAKAKRNGRDVV